MRNLEDYISHIVDASVSTGISRQVEAFKSGFNRVNALLQTFFIKVEWIVNYSDP